MKSLDLIKKNEIGIIKEINDQCPLKLRLLDIGFTSGSSITCIYTSLFDCLRAYKIKNTVVALRKNDARNIILEESV